MASVVDIIVLDDDDDEEGPSLPSEAKKSPAKAPPAAEVRKSPAEASPSPTVIKKGPVRASPPPKSEAKKGPTRSLPLTEAKRSPARASPPPTEVKKSPARAASPPQPPPSDPQVKVRKENDKSQIKAALSEENKKLFEEFVEYCSKLASDNPEVITYLQGRYEKANPDYLSSVEFRNTMGRCLSRVQSKKTKVFVYINELCTVLKAHTAKKRLALKLQATPQTTQNVVAEAGPSEEPAEAEEEGVTETKSASKRQIRYLENLLRLYAQEIQKLQEKELSLDDLEDEDSTYIQESRLKRKLLRIFDKLCELKDCSSLTGRVIEQRIQYKGTRYPEINRRLEKFINKDRDIFPDYGDVFQVVQRTNDKHSLGLTRKQMQSMAQDAFRELGNKLQDRRHLDMVYNFGCHLTDSYKSGNDPAFQDTSLARRLRENRNTAVNRLEDIIKKYAEMQDDGEDQGWKNKKSSELPSTSKDVKKNQPTSSSESEDEDDSEESDVDIDEELKQSEQAVDGEEDEEMVAEDGNEADQKMEEEQEQTDDSQNPSPANVEKEETEQGNEDEEAEQGDDDEKNEDEPMEEEGADEEQQESPLSSTSLSSEKESTTLDSEGDTMHSASPENSNDVPPPVGETEERAEQQQPDDVTPCVTSHETETRIDTKEQPEVSGPADDLTVKKDAEMANVPYIEVETPTGEGQDARKGTDPKDDSLMDSKSPLMKKEVRTGRLDQCINKLAGTLVHKVAAEKETPPPSPPTIRSESPSAKSTPKVKPEVRQSNGKLVCGDTPASSQDPVRKIAFSHLKLVDSSTDVLHLDTGTQSTHSNASNGVHRALVRSANPTNRLKLMKPTDSPRDAMKLIKLEKESPSSRKRKGSPKMWIRNGLTNCNGSENGDEQKEQKEKRAKHDCSSASVSSPSVMGSDNEHDLTLDMGVTCSPIQSPVKPPVPNKNKVDASTQCDPDEVIVLSD